MTANDTATRRVTTGIVLAVGLFAGSDSYSHIYTLARDHGQAIASAALLPLAGDGLIAAASSAMLVASRQGRDVPVLARVMLLAGIGATIAANVGYGLHAGLTGALLSVWPVAAYVGCMELLTWMRRNTGMHPAARPASADAAADAPDELARRRHSGRAACWTRPGGPSPLPGQATSRHCGRSSAPCASARARPSRSRLISPAVRRTRSRQGGTPMTYDDNDNDGRFPDESRVEVRYPRTRQEEHGDRAAWPWLPGSIVEQCGPDEWRVCVEDRGVAVLRDGRPAPRNTASRNLYYPMCFRDSSEIRRPAPAVPGPSVPALRVDATPAVRRTTAPAVRRGRSR